MSEIVPSTIHENRLSMIRRRLLVLIILYECLVGMFFIDTGIVDVYVESKVDGKTFSQWVAERGPGKNIACGF